jgi:RNA polymerase sigma-70 factor (ECF subfamily)
MTDPIPGHGALSPRQHVLAQLLEPNSTLGSSFAARCSEAEQRYPELRLAREQFARHLARVLDHRPLGSEPGLAELNFSDLYLACGCSLGLPAALSNFEGQYLKSLRSFVKDVDSSAARLDELKQTLRVRLLLGVEGSEPRIARYLGRGSLKAWVQVAAQRLALTTVRRSEPMHDDGAALTDHLSPDPDPELAYLRSRYAEEFRAALQGALAELSSRQRLLLRLHLVEGMSLSKIGTSYKVSQSTISRWFGAVREHVRDQAKRRLYELIGADSGAFDSMVRLLQSQLDLSLSQLLHSEAAVPLEPRTQSSE